MDKTRVKPLLQVLCFRCRCLWYNRKYARVHARPTVEFNRGAKRMPELGKALLFFAAFCAVMGRAVIELLIWLFGSIWLVWLG